MNKTELLQKIKALSDTGSGGEKLNAKKLLDKLMVKYNITETEISEDVINAYDIKWRGFESKKLAVQVFYSICGQLNGRHFYHYKYRSGGQIYCTSAEFLEYQAKYKFYQHHLNADSKMFYDAFVQRNNIFPDKPKIKQCDQQRELTEKDIEMLRLSSSLNKHNYYLQIDNKFKN